ncbi:oligosaccharide flippase family protein [Bacillus hwajinpoensis]|uniref:Oligosaccharide flippase family protein n=1 Tax=Guptibacillus hwajinpoensis TaxID=208199 RepID=A0A845ER12_9BACL|nr:oligosaccharide flippase family protein [Pseudalkalibacillus hwajinpoensis]MYL62212.1 oligosaccharide flippase family protein [Pseudalkalibacillus hwajinpoensis]
MKKPAGNSIFINILHLLYSTVLSSVLNAGALILLASYLQSSNYGMFSVALAFAMIMAYFTDAGLSQIVLREGSKDRANISIVMSSYIKIRLLLLAATFLLGFTIIHVMHAGDIELLKASYYLIIPFVIGVSMQSIATTYFQLAEKMQYTGIIRIVSSVLLVLSITLGMLFKWHPFLVYMSYGGAYMLAGLLGVFLVLKHTTIPIRAPFHRGLFNQLWSFTIAGLLFVILPQLGPILLERTVSLADVGLFAVAFRIPQALQQLPFIVAGAFYPVLFRYFNNNQVKDHESLNMIEIKVMGLIGMSMTVPLYYFATPIITLLFGAEWSESAHLLKIISIGLFLQGMTIAMADGLTTKALQLKRMMVQSLAVVSAIFLYWSLSQMNGLTGAAFACILIEVIALLGFLVIAPNRLFLGRKLLPYISTLLGGLLLSDWLLGNISLLATVVQYMLIGAYILIDKQLNRSILHFISRKRKEKGLRVRGARRVEDGL